MTDHTEHTGWFRVNTVLPLDFSDFYRARRQWCRDNCRGRWSEGFQELRPGFIRSPWEFEDKEDAAKFRLMFGEEV